MSDWATKRKRVWGSIVFVIIAIGVGVPTYLSFYKKPTCFDHKQNNGEKGIDCGGSCTQLCLADFSKPIYLWERFSAVASSTYSLLAFVENPNINAEAPLTSYSFKLYDNQGVLIVEEKGRTLIPRGKRFAVFVPMVKTAEKTPTKITFEFTAQPLWTASNEDIEYKVANPSYDTDLGFPRVRATIRNNSRTSYSNLESVVVLYDTSGNAINFSRTIVDDLPGEGSVPVVFTWQTPLKDSPAKIDILLRRYR